MNTKRLSNGSRAGITSKLLVALTLLLFLAACGSNAAATPVENQVGRDVYMQNCVVCHGDPVTGENAISGAPVHGPEGHTWHHAVGQLTSIIDGSFNFPSRTMPSFGDKLTESEIASVIDYIKAGWLPDQLSFNKEVSENWELLSR